MPAVSSEMYIPVMEYSNAPKFNSVDLRSPVVVLNEKINSPDQEVFQINASRSYESSPVEFDGSLRNSVIKTLENGHYKQPPVSIHEVARSEFLNKKDKEYSKNSSVDRNSDTISLSGLADGVRPVCVDCRKEIKR